MSPLTFIFLLPSLIFKILSFSNSSDFFCLLYSVFETFFYSLLCSHFCNFSMNTFPSLNLFLHSDIHISISFFLFFSIQFLFIHLISSLFLWFLSNFLHFLFHSHSSPNVFYFYISYGLPFSFSLISFSPFKSVWLQFSDLLFGRPKYQPIRFLFQICSVIWNLTINPTIFWPALSSTGSNAIIWTLSKCAALQILSHCCQS